MRPKVAKSNRAMKGSKAQTMSHRFSSRSFCTPSLPSLRRLHLQTVCVWSEYLQMEQSCCRPKEAFLLTIWNTQMTTVPSLSTALAKQPTSFTPTNMPNTLRVMVLSVLYGPGSSPQPCIFRQLSLQSVHLDGLKPDLQRHLPTWQEVLLINFVNKYVGAFLIQVKGTHIV